MKIFILLIAFTTLINSQDEKYFDAPFGLGGGFITGFYFVNLDDLNSKLNSIPFPKFDNQSIFIAGGGGFAYIGFIPNVRVGGLGFGGSISKSHIANKINYQVDYSINGGGLTVEYTLPIFKDFGVSLGAFFGSASIIVEYYENKQEFDWLSIFTANQKNNYSKLTNDFFTISPTLKIDIPFYRFIVFRLGCGYQYSLSTEWKANNNQSIKNMPDSFDGNSFFVHAGIYLGFFSF